MKTLSWIALGIVAAALAGCGAASADRGTPTPIVSHGGPVRDYVSLIDNLRAKGATVTPGEEISQSFFKVGGRIIRINGADVQVFEYANEDDAAADARQVAPGGGSVGTHMIMWMGPPHFYRTGRVIAIYIGADKTVTQLLEAVLGAQFAGA